MNRIKELRKLNDMTLLELAHKLGVSESTVQRYESGNIRMFNYDTISMLATIFNCRPEYVMGWDDGVPNIPNARPVSRKRFPVLGSVACGEPVLMTEERSVQIDASDDFDADFVLIARRVGHDSKVTKEVYYHVTKKMTEKDKARILSVRIV